MRNGTVLLILPLLLASCATGAARGEGAEPIMLGSVPAVVWPRPLGCSASRTQSPDGRLSVNDPSDQRILATGKSMRVSLVIGIDGRVESGVVTGLPGVGTDIWDVRPEDQSRAVAYAKTCRFEPAVLEGRPVAVKGYVMSVFVAVR